MGGKGKPNQNWVLKGLRRAWKKRQSRKNRREEEEKKNINKIHIYHVQTQKRTSKRYYLKERKTGDTVSFIYKTISASIVNQTPNNESA